MRSRFRPPLFVIAATLLGLIALLGTLQYRWLGRITEADRERRRAMLTTGAAEFAHDIDRELTRAYLLFQADPSDSERALADRFAARYDRWQASSRFPKLLREFHVFVTHPEEEPRLLRFDAATRALTPAGWPAEMADWRAHLVPEIADDAPSGALVIRRMAAPIWSAVPAIVSPMPVSMLVLSDRPHAHRIAPRFFYSIVTIDLDYLTGDLLPSLAHRHFGGGEAGLAFRVAVFNDQPRLVFRSDPEFAPAPDAPSDLTTDFFRIRTQEFTNLVTEVRRFTALAATAPVDGRSEAAGGSVALREGRPLSILVQPGSSGGGVSGEVGARTAAAAARTLTHTTPPWKLVLKHPSGSLDAAVGATRRRNLIISSSILAILGASMGLLVLSTRRAQRLARQQMEFVAAVSHELRTPLAVIQSAAENLADGVVQHESQVRQYGELVRSEGRRLTEMVEQILELAGIQSGQRGFALRPVSVETLLRDIVSSSAALIQDAGIAVEFAMPPDLPPVLGDEPALRRLFQNLVGNAMKYGASGGWIGLSAARHGAQVRVVVADRGMGIAAAEQARIFEPFYRAAEAVAAQIQGAGLGLSLVQRIVEAHDGRVWVKSATGAGSAFVVQLPAAGDGRPAREVDERDGPEALGPGAEAPRYT
jgi:signal transduction histidine kinase